MMSSRTTITSRSRRFSFVALAAAGALSLALSGCASSGDAAADGTEGSTVTLVVHDSFPNDEFAAAASAATGYNVEVITAGDGGELTNQLVLTKGAPIADVFFGVDQIFASRIISNDVAADVEIEDVPERANEFALAADGSTPSDANSAMNLVPIDLGATCFNIDTGWFTDAGVTAPVSYEDLLKPEYRGLTVLLDPTASSTGASFLVGTVAHFGEDKFVDYWSALVDNDARIEQGWTEAYNGQFTQGGGDGTFPIVVSYSSSPAFTVDGDATTTAALLDTCSSQIEYAGVLAGAANPTGGAAVLEFMLSSEFQDTIAESMYMYPVDADADVPAEWADFAPMPEAGKSNDLSPADIDAGREGWLKALSEAIQL